MKRSVLILMVPVFLALSCATEQAAVPVEPLPQVQAVEAPTPAPPPVVAQVPEEKPQEEKPQEEKPQEEAIPEEKPFDPENVSQEDKDTVMRDIQEMVGKLNAIVKAKNFNDWMSYMAEPSLRKLNSRAFLDERANDLFKKNQSIAAVQGQDITRVRKINFRNPQDYFNYVVVPSHTNDHVDDIGFISETQVTAYTRDEEKGQRLILYDLENIDGKWKIIIID
jgi:hypothetical protein